RWRDGVVRRDHREAAAREMALEHAREERFALGIERRERLVEEPRGGRVEPEAREADATALPRGEPSRRKPAARAEAHLPERLVHRVFPRGDATQRERIAQIFRRREIVLDAGGVAGIDRVLAKARLAAAGGARIPEHVARFGKHEPREAAQ